MASFAELTLLSFILYDIHVPLFQPPILFCDNISAVYLSVNLVFHAHTKHIELYCHFVLEKVALGHLVAKFVFSSN